MHDSLDKATGAMQHFSVENTMMIFENNNIAQKSPWSSMQCVGLLNEKAWVRILGQSSKKKKKKLSMKNISPATSSQRISGKNSEIKLNLT